MVRSFRVRCESFSVLIVISLPHLKDCKPDPRCTSLDAQLWRIGDGGVQRSSIMIIGAVNPSAISWMPILQLTRQPSANYDRFSDVRNRRIDWDAIFKLAS
jgi:hypothetical protein